MSDELQFVVVERAYLSTTEIIRSFLHTKFYPTAEGQLLHGSFKLRFLLLDDDTDNCEYRGHHQRIRG